MRRAASCSLESIFCASFFFFSFLFSACLSVLHLRSNDARPNLHKSPSNRSWSATTELEVMGELELHVMISHCRMEAVNYYRVRTAKKEANYYCTKNTWAYKRRPNQSSPGILAFHFHGCRVLCRIMRRSTKQSRRAQCESIKRKLVKQYSMHHLN